VKAGRLVFGLVPTGAVAVLGYLVLPITPSSASPQVTRFAFSQSLVPVGPASSFISAAESSPLFSGCSQPVVKTSITAAAAKAEGCDLLPQGGSFALLESPIAGAKPNAILNYDVRFVHSSRTQGLIDIGPVVMQFGNYSGGARPSLVYSTASFWLFDSATENGPEVLRISTTTGAVLQRTVMPAISRPQVAVDRYGFWMGQAGNSTYERNVVPGIWFAPLGANQGELLRRSDDQVFGMQQVGDSMVVDVAPEPGSRAYTWRFTPVVA
jgi:hypothetical protein